MAKNIDDWFIWVEANRDTPTRKWTEEVLPPAKQALYSDILELINIPVFKITEAPTTEYERGYNDMVEATRILLLEQRSNLEEYFNL